MGALRAGRAFRIIDNDVVRQALRGSSLNTVVVVSADFYEKIVRPGFGAIDSSRFLPLPVENKETSTVVWLQSAGGTTDVVELSTPTIQAGLGADRLPQHVLTIADLPPTSLYVAISDIHNTRLYERSFPGAPVRQHLECALLLANKVVVHCADPYRSQEVAGAITSLLPSV